MSDPAGIVTVSDTGASRPRGGAGARGAPSIADAIAIAGAFRIGIDPRLLHGSHTILRDDRADERDTPFSASVVPAALLDDGMILTSPDRPEAHGQIGTRAAGGALGDRGAAMAWSDDPVLAFAAGVPGRLELDTPAGKIAGTVAGIADEDVTALTSILSLGPLAASAYDSGEGRGFLSSAWRNITGLVHTLLGSWPGMGAQTIPGLDDSAFAGGMAGDWIENSDSSFDLWYWDDLAGESRLGADPSPAMVIDFLDSSSATLDASMTVDSMVFSSGNWSLAQGVTLAVTAQLTVGVTGPTTLTVGSGSVVNTSGAAVVGAGPDGQAILAITNGGTLTDTLATVATATGSSDATGLASPNPFIIGANSGQGTLQIDGPQSEAVLNNHGVVIGENGGHGVVTVSQGGTLIAGGSSSVEGYPSIAISDTGNATMVVTDRGSTVDGYGLVFIAHNRTGSLTVENGAAFVAAPDASGAAGLVVGSGKPFDQAVGGLGVATVSTGGMLTSEGFMTVGANGTAGVLTVSSGGVVESAQWLIIGLSSAGLPGNGHVLVGAGGRLRVDGIGQEGGAALMVGANGPSVGVLTIASGGLATVDGDVAIGPTSSITVIAGGTLDIGGGGTAATGITVESGSSLYGDGKVTAPSISNEGVIAATGGGALELAADVSGNGLLELDAGTTLKLDGKLGIANRIAFDTDSRETLILQDPGRSLANAISGLTEGDRIELGGRWILGAAMGPPGTVAVSTTAGDYMLTNVSFADGAGHAFTTGHDTATGYDFIQVGNPLTRVT